VDEIPDLKAWQAALAAFQEAAGKDANVKLQYTIAWAGAMNACLAFHRTQTLIDDAPDPNDG